MDTTINNCKIVTAKEAHLDYGFNIEGPMAFIFDMGGYRSAVLGWNSTEECWQFDVSVDKNGETWQFLEANLHIALEKAQAISKLFCMLDLHDVATKEVMVHAVEGILIKQGLIAL